MLLVSILLLHSKKKKLAVLRRRYGRAAAVERVCKNLLSSATLLEAEFSPQICCGPIHISAERQKVFYHEIAEVLIQRA